MNEAQRKEKRDAKDFGAKQQPRSGGFYDKPGDSKSENFLFDSKQTGKKSYSLKQQVWDKIYSEALHERRMPCLSIILGSGTELVVLGKADFMYIKDYFERYLDLSNS
jgi:hypothetical protein